MIMAITFGAALPSRRRTGINARILPGSVKKSDSSTHGGFVATLTDGRGVHCYQLANGLFVDLRRNGSTAGAKDFCGRYSSYSTSPQAKSKSVGFDPTGENEVAPVSCGRRARRFMNQFAHLFSPQA